MEVSGSWDAPDFAGRPLPDADMLSAGYWDAARHGELRIQECPACRHRQFYPRFLCTECGGTPEWMAASGRGTVHTFTVVRRNLAPPFDRLTPYVVAVVELDEGPRMMGNVTHCDPDRVRIGMEVTAYAVVADEGIGVPFWRPAEDLD
ncbi:MAG: Zn-ribbon domain-containing OB-fold protein [Acidimicrobiales bacterium]